MPALMLRFSGALLSRRPNVYAPGGNPPAELETQLQPKLDNARRSRSNKHAWRRIQIHDRTLIVHMIQAVHRFSAELQLPLLRDREILEQGQVDAVKAVAANNIATRVAEGSIRRSAESRRVESPSRWNVC